MFFIIAFVTGLFLIYRYLYANTNTKVPNGLKQIPLIKGLPLIGILHRLKPTMHHFFLEAGKSYGGILRVMIGMREVVVLNDIDFIKKSLKENGDIFSARPKIKALEVICNDSGIVFLDGDRWSKQRSFFLKVLRDFGLGKSKSASIVHNECLLFLNELESSDETTVDFTSLISFYTANIISKFVTNKRYVRDDEILRVIDKIMVDDARKKNPIQLLHFLLPILDGVGWITKITTFDKYKNLYDIFQREIDEHRSNLDINSEGDDLIDRFIIEQNKMKVRTGSFDTFTDSQLVRSLFEIFSAGYETTSTTLCWGLMFMSKNPHIQDKVHREIINQIGTERLTTMNDKKNLNYTQAVMDEILRWSTAFPTSIYHRTFNNCDINGFFIPGNSTILVNLFACHMDPKVWEKPDQFYPEHFLQVDSDGQMKYNPREELIPFSLGKRQCLGESLARMEYFIFFTGILQRFRVSFVEELTEKQFEEVLIGNDAIIRFCSVKDFIFKRRL